MKLAEIVHSPIIKIHLVLLVSIQVCLVYNVEFEILVLAPRKVACENHPLNPIFFQTYADEASDRIYQNLHALKDPAKLTNFRNMADISKAICENGSTLQINPLGF